MERPQEPARHSVTRKGGRDGARAERSQEDRLQVWQDGGGMRQKVRRTVI